MLARADGSGQARVTVAEETYEQEPGWSPDGKVLAYSGKMKATTKSTSSTPHGFDFDDVEHPEVPFNLTDSPDRDDKSPSWRPF